MADGYEFDDRPEAVPGLAARLASIETRPLADRSAAFGRLHDELRVVLEGADSVASSTGRP
ncbi:hypothetical protein ACPEEZ_05965 [Frigoribacterium sp. 2-23]|uniref:hypothetical protein n=1 Tax=Frigoribacterium sp. 2-23 TaxID=3415006 RepID=UPI003C6FB152